jgi:hypothetical protein
LKEKKRKIQVEEEELRLQSPKKQVVAYYDQVGTFPDKVEVSVSAEPKSADASTITASVSASKNAGTEATEKPASKKPAAKKTTATKKPSKSSSKVIVVEPGTKHGLDKVREGSLSMDEEVDDSITPGIICTHNSTSRFHEEVDTD